VRRTGRHPATCNHPCQDFTAVPFTATEACQGMHLGKSCHCFHGVKMTEWGNLDRQRKRRPKARAQLSVVDDADEFVRHHLNHFLTKQRTSATLDQRKARIDSVCAIDCDVELRALVQGAERDSEGLGLFASLLTRRNADQVLELTGLEFLPNTLNCKVCCRSSPKTNYHSRLDMVIHSLVPAHGCAVSITRRTAVHTVWREQGKRSNTRRPSLLPRTLHFARAGLSGCLSA
jgi:hypothetical protein